MSNLQLPDHLLLLLQQATDNYQSIVVKRKVGRAPTYSGLSFLLLAMTAVVLRTFDEIELHRLLLNDKDLLSACGFPQPPHRKTIGRRLARLVPEAETQVQLLGKQIQSALPVSVSISAIDGRMYQAAGSRWHKRDRQAGVIPPKLRARGYRKRVVKIELSRLDTRLSAGRADFGVSRAGSAFCRVGFKRGRRINRCQTSHQPSPTEHHRCFARR